MPDRSGPVLVTPEPWMSRGELCCNGCLHLARTFANGVCFNRCEHPETDETTIDWSKGNVRTPQWCPLLPKGQSE